MRALVRGSLLVLALLAAAPATAGEAGAPARDRLIRTALEQVAAGAWSSADAGFAALRALDPGHAAAPVYETEAMLWRLALRPRDTRFDAAIQQRLDEVEALARAALGRDPDDAEAELYWGFSLVQRARWLLLRRSWLRGALAGERGRVRLERAAVLDPGLDAVRLPLGMYHYYADILPDALRWLGWLWFVPRGDRERGLAYLEEVRAGVGPQQRLAMMVLVDVLGSWEDDRHDDALALISELERAFPENVAYHGDRMLLLFRMGRWVDVVDTSRSLEARASRLEGMDASYAVLARIWRARAQTRMGLGEGAWSTLDALPEPPSPDLPWAGAFVMLTRGEVHDLGGRRDEARRLYRAVLELDEAQRSMLAVRIAEEHLERPFVAANGTPAGR